jgi:glucans biosynthesis protein
VLQPGAEAPFAYRQFWCWTPPDRPALAIVTDTRGGRAGSSKHRKFIVEFTSDLFGDEARNATIKPTLTLSVGSIVSIRSFPSRERKTFRVLFELDFGGESSAELRLVLEAAGKPVSETWLYRWTA